MSGWLLAAWPSSSSDTTVAVVGARGANKRGVRAALYRTSGGAWAADMSFALHSNVVFAKCTALLDDANADTSQPSRVLAFERVPDERRAALASHALLHCEATRDNRRVFALGLLQESGGKLQYVHRAAYACADGEDLFANATEYRIVDAAPIVVARMINSSIVLVWNGDNAVRRFDLSALRLVDQWPAIPLSSSMEPVLLGIAAESAVSDLIHTRVPLQSSVLAGVSAAAALELAAGAVSAARGLTHQWVRITLCSDRTIDRALAWRGVLPAGAASLAVAAVCVDDAQQSAWIVTDSGTVLQCLNEQVVRSFEVGNRLSRVLRLVPVDLDDSPALAICGERGGTVAICRVRAAPASNEAIDVTLKENVVSVLRVSHSRLLLEFDPTQDSAAVLARIGVLPDNVVATHVKSTNDGAMRGRIAKALAARIRAANDHLNSSESLLVAKRDLIESRIALLEGKAAKRVDVPSLRVATVVAGDSGGATTIECDDDDDDDDDNVSIDQVEFQFPHQTSASPMRARCRVRVAAGADAMVGDVSVTVLVRDRALLSTSYAEAEFHMPSAPQVAAIAAGGFAVANVSDLRVACEAAMTSGDDGTNTSNAVTILVRWRWFRISTDDGGGRVEAVERRLRSHRLVALTTPHCRVVPAGDVEFLPHATTVYVLPTSRCIDSARLSSCVASEFAAAAGSVRVRAVHKSGNAAVVDASGQLGSGTMLRLRCASAAACVSIVSRLRELCRVEFDADVEEDASSDGTTERMACVALLHECQLLRALLEASRTGKPVELARVTEASVATDMAVNECVL